MKWASSLSRDSRFHAAVSTAAAETLEALDGQPAHVVFAFVSPHFRSNYQDISGLLKEFYPDAAFCGCTAIGVIGGGVECEQVPAVSLAAASLPGVDLNVFYTDTSDHPDEDAPPSEWTKWLGLREELAYQLVLFADPFSCPAETVVAGLDYAFPGTVKVGALASGAGKARENALFVNDQIYREGMAGVALSGNVAVDTVVAQGCRPVGEPLTVTCGNGNMILELNGMTPVKYLEQLLMRCDERERELMTSSLFVGVETAGFSEGTGKDPFLVRNVLGIDYETGAMAVGVGIVEGQVIQFHLRDRESSANDLEQQLLGHRDRVEGRRAAGALLFSCLGRGEYLYGETSHDSRLCRDILGDIPLAGFFGNGEIGPVDGVTHVHGYTSSLALFRPAE